MTMTHIVIFAAVALQMLTLWGWITSILSAHDWRRSYDGLHAEYRYLRHYSTPRDPKTGRYVKKGR